MDFSGIPIPTIKGLFEYKRQDINIDSTNIHENSAKLTSVGFTRKKFLIKCDGNGSFIFKKIQSTEDALRELSKLLKDEIITAEEFEKMKKDFANS